MALHVTRPAQALIFAYIDIGSNVEESAVNDWYDNEQAPRRLDVPGFIATSRYKAVDGQSPGWLNICDIETPGVIYTKAYIDLKDKSSDNEKLVLSKIEATSRRLCVPIATYTHPGYVENAPPSKYILTVGLEVTPEGEDELNEWYEVEHMDLLSKIPGWQRGRRFKVMDAFQTGTFADKPVFKYLAIHEFDNADFKETEEFKHASSTEWRTRVFQKVTGRDARTFELQKRHKN
ncbi:hypothetical protein FB45DRAFT_1053123 [Roridomyces roridus]|uniref:Uncharacterized protein n=1 Tax=Roridomyces roridus TaxID=1738132 RepID=A0AAD7CBH3_9AGAR|nr:hypothetical protein FB45DRAFT_1053123 [Roridomyces roridus]